MRGDFVFVFYLDGYHAYKVSKVICRFFTNHNYFSLSSFPLGQIGHYMDNTKVDFQHVNIFAYVALSVLSPYSHLLKLAGKENKCSPCFIKKGKF